MVHKKIKFTLKQWKDLMIFSKIPNTKSKEKLKEAIRLLKSDNLDLERNWTPENRGMYYRNMELIRKLEKMV
jgi:hypothetical protein